MQTPNRERDLRRTNIVFESNNVTGTQGSKYTLTCNRKNRPSLFDRHRIYSQFHRFVSAFLELDRGGILFIWLKLVGIHVSE